MSSLVSKDEDNNAVVRTWGSPEPKPGFKHHYEVLEKLDAFDAERGLSISSIVGASF